MPARPSLTFSPRSALIPAPISTKRSRKSTTPAAAPSSFARRTHDPELAADRRAETFAAALAGRHRYRPAARAAPAWLYGIASNKLADAQRRGYAERRAQRRLGMERITLSAGDAIRIERLAGDVDARSLVERLAPEQR